MNKAGLINKILFGSRADAAKQADNAALEKAFATVLKRQKDNASRLPLLDDMKKRLRESRASSAGDEGLLEKAIENLRKNGFRVREASGVEEAFNALVEEIGEEKTIVKSKSNLSKEMHLTDRLCSMGVEAVETDIGDRVIQFAKEKPSHPTGPASHLDAASIARIVSKALGKDVPSDPEAIVAVLRDDIKGAIARSKIGISGVNAITAEEGSVVIIHNEGNVAEITRLAGKHIILADTTKIYKDIPDALNMVKLQTYAATGAVTTSFI
ncbi:MAG: lactate utilization protein, partial [Geobacter sp.]|nr:lactate utilization protein [Geobacter sp.]